MEKVSTRRSLEKKSAAKVIAALNRKEVVAPPFPPHSPQHRLSWRLFFFFLKCRPRRQCSRWRDSPGCPEELSSLDKYSVRRSHRAHPIAGNGTAAVSVRLKRSLHKLLSGKSEKLMTGLSRRVLGFAYTGQSAGADRHCESVIVTMLRNQ